MSERACGTDKETNTVLVHALQRISVRTIDTLYRRSQQGTLRIEDDTPKMVHRSPDHMMNSAGNLLWQKLPPPAIFACVFENRVTVGV